MGLLSAYQRAIGKSGREHGQGGMGARLPIPEETANRAFRPKNPTIQPLSLSLFLVLSFNLSRERCPKHARTFRSTRFQYRVRGEGREEEGDTTTAD